MFELKNADPTVRDLARDFYRFEFYRLVDVQTHDVYDYKNGELVLLGKKCYNVWNRAENCLNCASGVAVSENKAMIKLEYLDKAIYFIESQPVIINGKKLAMELIREVTDCMCVADPLHRDNSDITGLVKELNDLAMRDSYTKLYNKRYAWQELKHYLEHMQEHPITLNVAMIDIDHFKAVNDTYGHQAGDSVIDGLVSFIRDELEGTGAWASRFGGDEFLLVFPDIPKETVQQMVQNINNTVSNFVFGKKEAEFHITVSLGMAEYTSEIENEKMLIEIADQEMYRMKDNSKERKRRYDKQ